MADDDLVHVGGLVLRYVAERHRRGELNERTADNQRRVLWAMACSVGRDRDIRRVRLVHLERWLAERPVAQSTARMRVATVKTFFGWCARMKLVARDPTVELRPPRAPRQVPRGLRPAAVAAVFAVLPDERATLMVSLMVQEGLRCMEVAGLQLGDIDGDEHVMRVVGKGGHERILPISDETWRAMRSYLAAAKHRAGPLIRSEAHPDRPLRARYVSRLVGEWMHAAGVAESAHALRHTAASDMLKQGAHVRDVQQALGHVSLQTTQRYLPLVVKDLREAMGGRTYRTMPLAGREEG